MVQNHVIWSVYLSPIIYNFQNLYLWKKNLVSFFPAYNFYFHLPIFITPDISTRPNVTHWSWWLGAFIVYSILLTVGIWKARDSDLYDVIPASFGILGIWLNPHINFRYLTRLPLYPVQHTRAVGPSFVIILSLSTSDFALRKSSIWHAGVNTLFFSSLWWDAEWCFVQWSAKFCFTGFQ